MRCLYCNNEMIYEGFGNYHCGICDLTLNDIVFRNKDYSFGIIQQEQPQFYEQGWVCPKCGGVMSPNQYYCINCQPKNIQVTNTGITQPIQTENKSISKGE